LEYLLQSPRYTTERGRDTRGVDAEPKGLTRRQLSHPRRSLSFAKELTFLSWEGWKLGARHFPVELTQSLKELHAGPHSYCPKAT